MSLLWWSRHHEDVPPALYYIGWSELGGQVVLGQDNTVKLGEDRHLGDLFPFPGVQSIDDHRESVDGKGSHGGGACGALLFVASALLWPSCSRVGGAPVKGDVLAGVVG